MDREREKERERLVEWYLNKSGETVSCVAFTYDTEEQPLHAWKLGRSRLCPYLTPPPGKVYIF